MSPSVFCVVLVFAAIAYAERVYVNIPQEYLPDMIKASIECIAKTGVQPDIIAKVLSWNFQDSENVRNYIYCAVTNAGYGDSKGHYITEKMVKLAGNHELKDEFTKSIDECNKIQGSDEKETMYKITICLRETAPIWLTI